MSITSAEKNVKIDGVVIGVVTALNSSGSPLVAYAGNVSDLPIAAKSTLGIDSNAIGREVALLFEAGDVTKPIIMGLLHNTSLSNKLIPQEIEAESRDSSVGTWPPIKAENEVIVDGRRIWLEAKDELVLKCGRSSITMTRAGKVVIRGAYISTRSSGANRIKGGSVQIN